MRLGKNITVKDFGRFKVPPSFRNTPGCQSKIVATCGKSNTVNRSRGGASDDRKRITLGLDAFQLANAFENTSLISAASTAARHDQADRISHRPL